MLPKVNHVRAVDVCMRVGFEGYNGWVETLSSMIALVWYYRHPFNLLS